MQQQAVKLTEQYVIIHLHIVTIILTSGFPWERNLTGRILYFVSSDFSKNLMSNLLHLKC